MKLTHKQKLKKARSLMSKEEIKNHVSPFDSRAWNNNKLAKQKSIEGRIKKIKSRKK